MKKTQLSISITLALTLVPTLLLIGCSSDSDSDKNVQGDAGSLPDSPFNTMVKSELLFNPTVNGDVGQATQYLNGKLGTNGSLTSAQSSALNGSIASAKAVDGDHPFKATAAVVDQVVTSKSFDIAVTADDIAAQQFVKKDLQLNTQKVTWKEVHSDEDPRGMVLLDGRDLTVIATDEPNSLIVVSTNNPEVKSQKPFAAVEGPEHTIDAVTGASEHGLRQIEAASDGGSVYVSVRPEQEDGVPRVGNDQDDRYGLFRIAIDGDSVSADHNDPGSKRFNSAYIGAFHIAADGKVYVEDTDAEIVRVLDADLNDTGSTLTLPTDIEADEIFFTADDTMYVATKGDSKATPPVAAQLHKVNGQTGEVTASMDIDEAPDRLVLFDGGKQALAYKDFYAAIIDLDNMKESRRLPLSEDLDQEIQAGTVSPDGHYAILSGHENAEVWIFDLTLPASRMEKLIPTDTVIRALAFDSKDTLYAAGRDGFVDVSKLTVGEVLTPKQAIASDQTFITEESLNDGQPLSLVVSDLSLYPTVPAGGGSSIEWVTTGASINTTSSDENPLGKVTRPQNADENGTLTANLTYTFRDITESGDKAFNTLVRLAPAELPVQGEPLASGKLPNGFVRHIDASPDGSRGAAGFHGKGGFNIITRGADDAAQYGLSTTEEEGVITHQVFPAPYTDQRPVGVQFLDDATVMIAVAQGEDADGNTSPGALLVYGADDAAIAGKSAPLKKTLVQDGKIQSVSHKVNGKVAVVVESEDGRKAVIIDANNPNESNPEIALSSTAEAITISEDAQSVFVIEEDGIGKYSGASGTRVAHAAQTDDFKPRSIVMSAGIIYVGTEDGKLFRFNAADLASAGDSFSTGYNKGVRTIDVIDGKAYMSIRGFGVAIVDPVADKEIAFFAHEKQRHAGVSDDGSFIFASQYLGRPASEIVVLKSSN